MIALRDLIGTPFAIPCNPPESYDCWELVRAARKVMDKITPSYVDRDKRTAMSHRRIKYCESEWDRLDVPRLGCIVKIGDGHVGVYLGNNQVLHAHQSGARVDSTAVLSIGQTVTYWEVRHA